MGTQHGGRSEGLGQENSGQEAHVSGGYMSLSGWPLYTAAQVRELDRLAIEAGVSADELMRRAGQAAFNLMKAMWPDIRTVLVLCGTGNNGGDGYVIAELAQASGWSVTVLHMGDSTTDTARLATESALQHNVLIEKFTSQKLARLLAGDLRQPCIVVDALLGIGIKGALRAGYREAVGQLNSSGLPVLAIDVPTGLDSDTGRVVDVAMRCAATISFIGRKQGLYTGRSADFTGQLFFDDLDVSAMIDQSNVARGFSARAIDAGILTQLISPRSRAAHKGSFGNVLVIGGDHGFGGAALLAAEAAARAGAGTVSLITRAAHVSAVLARRPEIMVLGLEDWAGADAGRVLGLFEKATVIVIGPGLGQSAWSTEALQCLLDWVSRHEKPVVLDADALNLFARQSRDWQDSASAGFRRNWVLTPHPGEASRLLGVPVTEIQADRFAAVRALQFLSGAVCLIKGAGTVMAFPCGSGKGASSDPVDVCTTGNPGMATGGMGDVLAGILGALIAQGLSPADAIRASVCAHGEAGDRAASESGERGLIATDLLSHLRNVLNFC